MGNRAKILLVLLFGTIVILLSLQTPVLAQTRSLAWQFFIKYVAAIAQIGPLQIENDVLSQLETLQTENVRLKAELTDYARLRRELGSSAYENMRQVQALVIARPIDAYRSELVLNKGAKDGVVSGAPVVTYNAQLIGYTTDIQEYSSISRLLLNPATVIPAEVDGAENSRGLLRGQSFTGIVLTTIARDAQISEGQPIVTVAAQQTPHGLLVGYAGKISGENNQAYQEVSVNLPYDPDSIGAVTILVEP